jgi:hypothetical protein
MMMAASGFELVHSFPRRARELVVAALTEYKGKQYVDIRIHYEFDQGSGGFSPTRKGITIPVERLGDLDAAIAELTKAIRRNASRAETHGADAGAESPPHSPQGSGGTLALDARCGAAA